MNNKAYTAVQVCNAGDWPEQLSMDEYDPLLAAYNNGDGNQQGEVIDEACDSQGVHWQQGTDREWKATGYCCANCLEIDERINKAKL